MTRSVQFSDLPLEWFDRPQYRPRVELDGRSEWFILSPTFQPELDVPLVPPREPPAGRPALRSAFEETYDAWKIPRRGPTERSLEEVAEAGTAVIVAGQQPGFLGGPLHTVYKALSAVAAARRYRIATGRPCVPVFWVAADDHDLDEVRDAYFPGPDGGDVSFRFPGESDRRPLEDYEVGAAALEVLDATDRHFEGRRFADKAHALMALYRGRGLASGFAAMIADLLGHTGLLVLNPVAVRPMAGRIFRGAIEEPRTILGLVATGRTEVEAKGMKPLVAERLPLFLVRDGKRHHLSPTEDGLAIDGGGPALSLKDALQALARDPRCFSPGALLRPVVQEECLPCVLSVGGPAEVGYFAQIGPLAAHFGFERPRIALRLNATLVEGKLARAASAMPLETIARARSPEDLLAPEEEPEPLRIARGLAGQVEETLVKAIGEAAPPADAERLRKRAKSIAADIASLAERLAKARLGGRTREIEEARKLWSFIFPGEVLQERRWNVLHFVAKHGTGWLDEIIAAIEEDPLRIAHRWVVFEPMPHGTE